MDKHGEANRRFFSIYANAPKIMVLKSNATLNVHNEEAYQSSEAFGLVPLT
jgi:hypothetical protein